MRLLVVTQYFWPETFRINELVLGLQELGHRVTVLTGKPNYPGGRLFPGYRLIGGWHEDYQGVEVVRVPLVPRGDGNGLRLALNYTSFALLASVLGPLKCHGSYDAILVYEPSPVTVGLPALVMKRFKQAPILFWVQDLWPESLSATGAIKSKWFLGMVESLVRIIYRGSDRILVQSEAFRSSIERFGVKRENIMYFPNSAEPFYQPLSLGPEAPEHIQMPKGFRVVFGGNIGKAQSFETILDAAELLKDQQDIHWIVLGDGRMLSWVRDEIRKRGLENTVHLLGRFPAEVMPRYFALADVLLVTLRKQPIFALTIPSKVQSYLACGKPIIAALEGEGARIVQEAGAGLTPSPEDPKTLADAILAMYHMPEEARLAMGLRGRSYFEAHFDRALLLERLDGWISEVKRATVACVS